MNNSAAILSSVPYVATGATIAADMRNIVAGRDIWRCRFAQKQLDRQIERVQIAPEVVDLSLIVQQPHPAEKAEAKPCYCKGKDDAPIDPVYCKLCHQ